MSRRLGLVVAVILAGFGAWWVTNTLVVGASGLHQVDGYWLGTETKCADADAPDYCDAAVQTATQVLAVQIQADVIGGTIASPSCSSTSDVICTTAGLFADVFAVLDLRDGSRQVVGLRCEPTVTQGSQVSSAWSCQPADLSFPQPKSP